MTSTQELLRSLIGHTIRGGCDTCDAEQTMTEEPRHPGIFHLTIHHDDTCPTLRRIRAS